MTQEKRNELVSLAQTRFGEKIAPQISALQDLLILTATRIVNAVIDEVSKSYEAKVTSLEDEITKLKSESGFEEKDCE